MKSDSMPSDPTAPPTTAASANRTAAPAPAPPPAPAFAAPMSATVPRAATVELPKGGGAVRGIGEKLEVQAATGTCSVSLPLPLSPGRGGADPSVGLAYSSGAGNGPFGVGFALGVPAITRKTEKGLPRYEDADESDVFVLAGSEDLVPTLKEVSSAWVRDERTEDGYAVRRYRPRVEGGFARIERWTATATGVAHWRTTSPANVTSVFGRTSDARIADLADATRIFAWLLEETRDDRGNVVAYTYKPEDADGIDRQAPHEQHRLAAGAGFAQRYLKRVHYGNTTPGVADDWLFELVFDYGEHDADAPTPAEDIAWPCRQDPFSTYRAGFEVRTYRLCRRALMFHRFAELGEDPCLVRATDFAYDENPVLTLLTSVGMTGYVRNESGGYDSLGVPRTEFAYTPRALNGEVREVPDASLDNLPTGLGQRPYQWVDLDGEGLAGVLTEVDGCWYYKRNLGEGQLGPLEAIDARPSFGGLASGATLLTDVDGAGPKRLVVHGGAQAGFFDRDDTDGAWGPFRPFDAWPQLDWADPHLRYLDLDGDGNPDILISRDELWVWYPSLGEGGFGPARYVPMPDDEARGARVVFADPLETIFLADMSGDGLTDIVRIRNSDVCYWPNLGHGRFGARVAMGGAPEFDHPDQFHPHRLRLADVDGSGTTDVIYLGRDAVTVYANRAGNGFAPGEVLAQFPVGDGIGTISVLDLLGRGTACLVRWSPLPNPRERAIQFVDLMGGVKPHLLARVVNNLGKETRYRYAASTRFYLDDRAAGHPWVTRLPFPVQVVERVATRDGVTGAQLVTKYAFHHGHYDREEREFRGFGRVEQWDAEDYDAFSASGLFPELPTNADPGVFSPPVRTVTWIHTGRFIGQDRVRTQYETEYFRGDAAAGTLVDAVLPPGLSAQEAREACRALRGSVLRTEVYGLDGSDLADKPYTVTAASYAVQRVQPANGQRYGVFLAHPRESRSLHYERQADDPRITQALTLAVDGFGHVVRSAAVAYPRRVPAYDEQGVTVITCSESTVVHKAEEASWYRLGIPVEGIAYELTGVDAPTGTFYTAEAIDAAMQAADVIAFEATPSGALEKRVISRARAVYLADDLSGPLALGEVESLALPYKTYALALTPGLVTAAYGDRVDDTMLTGEGGYVSIDDAWWAPSGHAVFDADHFYVPTTVYDPFGNATTATYDGYTLSVVSVEDALGNTVSATPDYRVLSPVEVTDPNGNRSAAAFDARGVVIAMAVMGKPDAAEGDTLEDPTATYEYHPFNWADGLGPNSARVRMRERHRDADTPWQEHWTYFDGFGRVAMTKAQAEPGDAPARDEDGRVARDWDGHIVFADTSPELRWVGSGRTVVNNKGAPVKQYEPFFSALPDFESEDDIVEWGVTSVLRYDPVGRVVRTDMPDGTLSRVVFDPWREAHWDANDTVLESAWYSTRIALATSHPDYRAATLAAAHASTPGVVHMDTLGRPFLGIEDNGGTDQFTTRTVRDVQGFTRSVTDARNIEVLNTTVDLAGHALRSASSDAGESRALLDVLGQPIRAWSARDFRTRVVRDALQRVTHRYVAAGDADETLAERMVYGEAADIPEEDNLRGRVCRQFDAAGVVAHSGYDFKGNLLGSARRCTTDYTVDPDWVDLATLTALGDIDDAGDALLESTGYAATTAYDALNRPTRTVGHDASDTRPGYNAAGRLETVEVYVRGAASATGFVTGLDYDAKGRRTRIAYGNGVVTTWTYDPQNQRLLRLMSTRSGGAVTLQDLAYTYDAVGNVVAMADRADQSVLFSGTVVAADGRYEYDALYRLVYAEGREHPGTVGSAQSDWTDGGRGGQAHPNDGAALRRYSEGYDYDAVGNITRVLHQTSADSWSRRYGYATDSNRLMATSMPGDLDVGPYSADFTHDAAGNMTSMPSLPPLDDEIEDSILWDHAERLRQVRFSDGRRAYYAYDAAGQRVRKMLVGAGGGRQERLLPGGAEVYREWAGATLEKERQTLRVMDDTRCVAEVDTLTVDAGDAISTPASMLRYQLDNHLGSATIELDHDAAVISYEEYHPYGTTAYEARASGTEVPPRRYRYTGQERDEETGLQRHGVRYYAAWLGRWTSADPAGLSAGVNQFVYARNAPSGLIDRDGLTPQPSGPNTRRAGGAEENLVRTDSIARVLDEHLQSWTRGIELNNTATTGMLAAMPVGAMTLPQRPANPLTSDFPSLTLESPPPMPFTTFPYRGGLSMLYLEGSIRISMPRNSPRMWLNNNNGGLMGNIGVAHRYGGGGVERVERGAALVQFENAEQSTAAHLALIHGWIGRGTTVQQAVERQVGVQRRADGSLVPPSYEDTRTHHVMRANANGGAADDVTAYMNMVVSVASRVAQRRRLPGGTIGAGTLLNEQNYDIVERTMRFRESQWLISWSPTFAGVELRAGEPGMPSWGRPGLGLQPGGDRTPSGQQPRNQIHLLGQPLQLTVPMDRIQLPAPTWMSPQRAR